MEYQDAAGHALNEFVWTDFLALRCLGNITRQSRRAVLVSVMPHRAQVHFMRFSGRGWPDSGSHQGFSGCTNFRLLFASRSLMLGGASKSAALMLCPLVAA